MKVAFHTLLGYGGMPQKLVLQCDEAYEHLKVDSYF